MNEDCGSLIKMSHEALERRANNELRISNLTLTQVHLLLALYESEQETCSMKELEKKLRVAQSTIVGITSRLERKHFITSISVPDDKRIKKVRLTDEGRECCLIAKKKMEQSETFLLSGLDEQEKAEFKRLLKKVYDTIK